MCAFVFKQNAAYDLCFRDWSSDVCSSDLAARVGRHPASRLQCAGAEHGQQGGRPAEADPRLRQGQRPCRDRALFGPWRIMGRAQGFLRSRHEGRQAGRADGREGKQEIGSASCRERVCKYVYISVCALSLKKKNQKTKSQK